MNLLSGNVKIRAKKYPILWTGQNAQHLSEKHQSQNALHPFLHVEVQQMAQKAEWKKDGSGRTYLGRIEVNEGKFWIFGILHNNFFELKTCYKHG